MSEEKSTDSKQSVSVFPKTLAGFYTQNFFRYLGKRWILWSIIFIVSNSAWRVLVPLYTKYFVRILETYVPGGDIMAQLIPFGIMVLAVFAVINMLSYMRDTITQNIVPLSTQKISEDIYDYVYRQSVSFYSATMPGKISSQAGLIAGGFPQIYRLMFGEMAAILVAVIINMGFVFQLNWQIAMVLIAGTVFRILWSLYRRKMLKETSKRRSEAASKLNGKLLDSVSNFFIVKLFAGKKNEENHMVSIRREVAKTTEESRRQNKLFWILPSCIEDFFTVCVMVVAGMLFARGNMPISDAVFIITIYSTISGMVWNFVYQLPDLQDSYSSAAEAYEKLIKPIEIQDEPNAPALNVTRGMIEFRGLTFKYKRNMNLVTEEDDVKTKSKAKEKDSKIILDDLNIVIRPGEKVGLVGSSGAGKTTLVNLLMRLYDPTKGQILIDGQNIREVTQDSLRENIAFIPQEPTMFNRTLKDNIGYGRMDATPAEIKRAAKRASADEFIMETAKKYDSLVGDRGIKLSGGQKQRIAIARAFLKNAPILILDEATAALDSETEAAIQKSFEELSAGRTTIAIAHRLSTLRNMDRIIVLDKGRVAEDGSHAQLVRKKNGIYARLWRMQSGGFLQEG
ncbi:MAG: ABC transporter ATP-binding protein/permease [Alphaproteobacteria bacterium]|nr:ABC transporter ATP-binding protein/permease [Alphaproteobacteria bacterium]